MTKELQSSRYIVISFLVREMGIDIVEAISLMAELEKKWLGSLGIKWRFNTQRTWRSAMKRITANQYQTSERYYKLPKILFEDEKYMDMKLEVKVAYSILKDRLELSLSRGWIDEEGAVYLVFSNSKLMRLLGCSKSKLLSIKKTLKEYDLIDEVQQSSSEKGRLANKIYLGELSSTPVANSNRPSVKKRLGQDENDTDPVSHLAPSETEVSETESLFIEEEEERNSQPILRRKVEKVTKYDRDYIWGLVQDQFRREGFSETGSEIAMTDFERIYQYALDNVRFVRRAEVLAEFVFNGLYSVWNNRVRKGGG